ncbi:THA11-like protein, partial [Mya arenaria]
MSEQPNPTTASRTGSPKTHGRYTGSVGDFCCVPGCSNARGRCNRQGLNISFYRFPKEKKRADLWLNRIRRGEMKDSKVVPFVPKGHYRVCSIHFEGGKKVDEPAHVAYIPTIFPRNSSIKRSTQRSKEADMNTPSPTTEKKMPRRIETSTSSGRPSTSTRLNFNSKLENAVWNGDHNYVACGVKTKVTDAETEELFIVLVKLKTGNFNEDLAMTFDISPTHVSSIFTTHINLLANELKILFEMQASDEEQANNLKVVLDCTELMAQRAANLDVRKKTFSNYKHDSSKFLVGLSPNLTTLGWESIRQKITLNSEGLMDHLKPGDAVMADRGFNVAMEFKKKGVQLLTPDFKGRDRAQITAEEARRSEYISKARIHVKRIIQRIKTFCFLERTMRLNMQDIITQVFIVCAYLTNIQMPI